MKRIGVRALRERVEHRLEAFFEVAAEARAREQRRRVEREDFRAAQCLRHIGLTETLGEPFGHGGLADPGIPDEHGTVLSPTAEDLHRALELALAADERVEQPGGGALREVHRVRRKRVSRHRRQIVAARVLRAFRNGVVCRWPGVCRDLPDAVRDVVEDVEARHALAGEEPGRERLGLLQRRCEDVARPHLGAARALHVQHGRLQRAPEGECLRRFLLASARHLFDLAVQVLVEIAPQLRQVSAARAENGFAVRVVGKRVQQVLERQVGMTPRGRLAMGDRQHDLERLAEHRYACSMMACSG